MEIEKRMGRQAGKQTGRQTDSGGRASRKWPREQQYLSWEGDRQQKKSSASLVPRVTQRLFPEGRIVA